MRRKSIRAKTLILPSPGGRGFQLEGRGEISSHLRRRRALVADQADYFAGGEGDVGAGAVDRAGAGGAQRLVILRRDDAAADDDDGLAALRAERRDEGGDQRLVGGGLARDADDVDVVLDRLAGAFLG